MEYVTSELKDALKDIEGIEYNGLVFRVGFGEENAYV